MQQIVPKTEHATNRPATINKARKTFPFPPPLALPLGGSPRPGGVFSFFLSCRSRSRNVLSEPPFTRSTSEETYYRERPSRVRRRANSSLFSSPNPSSSAQRVTARIAAPAPASLQARHQRRHRRPGSWPWHTSPHHEPAARGPRRRFLLRARSGLPCAVEGLACAYAHRRVAR